MKKLLVAACAALGCVAFGDGVEVLDTDYLSFSTGEAEGCERPWEIVEGAGFSGGPAVRGPFGICDSVFFRGNLYAYDNGGAGTLSFYWKKYGNGSNFNWSMYIDEDRYVPISMYGPKVVPGQWNKMEIPFYGDDSRSIQWSSQGYSTALMLSDIVFTPAPETMSVSFDANGGTVSEKGREYAPGDYYETLPVPTRKNFTFLGWHRDSVDGAKEDASYRVPLKESTVLVAKWGSAVSAFNTKQLTAFKASGADKWYAVQNESLKVAEVEPKGAMKEVSSMCSGPELRLVDSSSSLQTTTVAAGYLKFSYSLATFSNPESGVSTSPWISLKVLLDGEEIEYAEVTGADGDSGEKTAYVYVPSGKHSLKFAVEGNPGWYHHDADGNWQDIYDPETGDWIDEEWVETPEINETGPLPRARVWGFDFEPAGPQPDLKAWMGKVKQFKSWRTGDLAKFAAAYKTRMIAGPSDHEARILYAATRLGALAENKLFTDTAKTFGMTIDWARLSVKPPKPKFDKKSTPLNTLADKTISLAVPVIKDVQKALQGIPDNWDGSVSFDSSEWPIDETVSFDVADVKFALAGLEASLAGLYYLGGYDLTANWPKMQSTLDYESKILSVKSIPATGDAAAWEKTARCFRASVETYASDVRTAGSGAFAVNGEHLLLRLAYDLEDGFLNETNQIQNFDFYIKSGDRTLNIWGDIYGENGRQQKTGGCYVDAETGDLLCLPAEPNTVPRNYVTQTNVYCNVWDSKTDDEWTASAKIELVDGALRLNVDLSKINLGTKKKPVKFSSKTWTVSNGEVGIVTWRKSDYESFEEYPDSYDEGWYDDEDNWMGYSFWNEETRQWENLAPWEDSDDYQPYYEYYKNWTGWIGWSRQSDSERKFYKHLTEQTAMFSKVRDASRLSAAKRHFESALRTALAADEKAQARPSDGPMHFFEYDPADEAKIVFARNNTERALEALGNGVAIDWAKVAEEFDAAKFKRSGKPCLSEFDYTLLPDEGMTRLFLGALFEGKIDRSMLPPMRANAYGDIVPDFEGMKDPTIGGLFPDMTADAIAKLSGRFASERELDRGEHVDPDALDALPKPGEKISLSFESYKGWTASDLPKGWKWDKAKGVLTGTASATTTVKFTKGKNTATETIEVGEKPSALLFSDNEDAVAVTGTGLYNVGATVKAVAAVKAGYVFAGWYAADGSLASSGASYSFKMPREGVVLTARTLPLSGEYGDRLFVDKNSGEEFLDPGEDADLSVFNNIESGTPFSVAVAGLPAGLSITNSIVQSAYSGFWYGTVGVVGKPAKAGVYYATFSVKNNGGFKWKHVVKFTVGDATEKVQNAANIDFSSLDGIRLAAGVPFYAALPYGPKAVKNGFVAVKKIAVSGLPAGLKTRYTSDTIEIAGYPGAAGKYTPTFTVTYADKKTAKSVKTIIVDEYRSAYVQAGVIDNDPDGAVKIAALVVPNVQGRGAQPILFVEFDQFEQDTILRF